MRSHLLRLASFFIKQKIFLQLFDDLNLLLKVVTMNRWMRHDDVVFNARVILFYFKVCNNIIATKFFRFAWNCNHLQGLYFLKLVMNCPFNKDSPIDIFTFNLVLNKTPYLYFVNYSCVWQLCF